MLKTEKITPNKIAYDRPSIKLISFLRKHYNLEKYVPQNNNFIVYDDYFIVIEFLFRNQLIKISRNSLIVMSSIAMIPIQEFNKRKKKKPKLMLQIIIRK
jgi:hypothetical protein